ncbi:polysaccharide deacetylase family protein [Microbispora sp. RL4-1S]|uniref:Polysaccharide deacetylase family protein n=1 Tax=Microbispora oryzae TaxID=2806554 RepID=A0A941ANJ7_9ACTN|nr:polysaccharide deacetylase family protein [Microbispora oryzae]MBP2702779.1 polysaccharide deacetylase family protein [Microbispora oryzae]
MWYAGIGWGADGYEIVAVDGAGAPVAPPNRFDGTGTAEPVAYLRSLAERNGGDLIAVIDSTNGVVDGELMAAGVTVYRADPWDVAPRPAFGSPPATALAEAARSRLSRLTRLSLDSGTLGGREDQADADIDRGAPVERELIARGRCIVHAGRAQPEVALTFDDGPHPVHTPRVLDVLRRYRVTATFFCVGLHVRAHPGIAARIADEGHTLGNHTWSHPYLPDLGRDEVLGQVDRTAEALRRATGETPTLLRPPYGGRSPEVLSWLAEAGQTTVLWDVEAADWAMVGAPAIVRNVVDGTDFGSIILLHDGGGDRSQTADALPGILEFLLVRGCRFVPVDHLLASVRVPTQA